MNRRKLRMYIRSLENSSALPQTNTASQVIYVMLNYQDMPNLPNEPLKMPPNFVWSWNSCCLHSDQVARDCHDLVLSLQRRLINWGSLPGYKIAAVYLARKSPSFAYKLGIEIRLREAAERLSLSGGPAVFNTSWVWQGTLSTLSCQSEYEK